MWRIFATLIIGCSASFAQTVENKSLTISYNKTTSIIFPFSITSVDRGSKDILAQKARGVENVLQLKAGRKDFPETNLTVITADGILHQFTIAYGEGPTTETITIASALTEQNIILAKDAINEKNIQEDSRVVLQQSPGKVDKTSKYRLVFALQNIFVHGGTLYFRILIINNSSIDYDVKSSKFLIRDKKKVKRTSSQELEIVPLYVDNKTEHIEGYTSKTMVYAIKKFTIPDGKTLHINLFEEYGGRNLSLTIHNKDILNSRMLPATKNFLSVN
jgi:conjugative transposon TraN protein